jgi:hypothetical protein
MKRLIWAVVTFSLLATVCRAQGIPQADVAAGYSHFHILKGFTIPMEGGSGSVAVNANDWLGIAADVGGYGSHGLGFTGETYVFGPRLCYRNIHRLVPFAQALFGGAHFSAPFGGAPDAKGNHFSFGFGGGVDLVLVSSGKVALRPQADYFGVEMNGSRIDNVRLSIGIVFRFGSRR